MSSFSGFREGINFLKRRFSSNDLPSENQEDVLNNTPVADVVTNVAESPSTNITTAQQMEFASSSNSIQSNDTAITMINVTTASPIVVTTEPTTTSIASNATTTTTTTAASAPKKTSSLLSFSQKGPFPSAPSSPMKATSSKNEIAGEKNVADVNAGKTNEGLSFTKNLFGRNTSQQQKSTSFFEKGFFSSPQQQQQQQQHQPQEIEEFKTLLVIDDTPDIHWDKYFNGRQVPNTNIGLKVEQTDFSNMVVTSSTIDGHVMVHLKNTPDRSLIPDIVLIRQKVKDSCYDWRPVICGFILGGANCVNTPTSLYNSADRQWMMAKLESLKRINHSDMPLIERTYFSSRLDLIKIETQKDWLDLLNFISESNFTVEPFVDAAHDVRVQKIGDHYRAFKRTSLNGNWKISCDQVLLEEIPVTDRYKKWLEECSTIFDEMDLCSLQILVTLDGKEFVIDAYDSTMQLLGDSQEADRKLISDVVLERMKQVLLKKGTGDKRARSSGSSVKSLKSTKSSSRDQVEDSEDTMRNLRKTFAGIFGDM